MTVEQAAPERPSVRLCATPPAEPEPDAGAGWIASEDLAQAGAYAQGRAALLAESWLDDFIAWAREGWSIVEAERKRKCGVSGAGFDAQAIENAN